MKEGRKEGRKGRREEGKKGRIQKRKRRIRNESME